MYVYLYIYIYIYLNIYTYRWDKFGQFGRFPPRFWWRIATFTPPSARHWTFVVLRRPPPCGPHLGPGPENSGQTSPLVEKDGQMMQKFSQSLVISNLRENMSRRRIHHTSNISKCSFDKDLPTAHNFGLFWVYQEKRFGFGRAFMQVGRT